MQLVNPEMQECLMFREKIFQKFIIVSSILQMQKNMMCLLWVEVILRLKQQLQLQNMLIQ